MTYQVSSLDLSSVRLNLEDPTASALQNIAVILATPKGSVPLYRDFGLDMQALDRPIPIAKILLASRVREAVEQWEPRATVLDVSFQEDPSQPGRLIPTVEVELHD